VQLLKSFHIDPATSTALTINQEASLHVLIAKFHASQTTSIANSTFDVARRTYFDAIVAGNKEAALAAIPTIANGLTESASTRLQRNVEFVGSIIEVLDQNQVKALNQRFGAAGVVRFLSILGTATPLDDVDPHKGNR
jgi:negative regulator of replication initiation